MKCESGDKDRAQKIIKKKTHKKNGMNVITNGHTNREKFGRFVIK